MPRKISYVLFAVTLLPCLLLYMFLWKPREEFPNQPIDRIVLITIDTLRADHLGCYGYPRHISPFIDSISEKGILFQRSFASMATTVPSHASIFTSLYPLQHRVLKNGHKLSDSFLTIAELLRELNYETAAFVSCRHFKAANMDQGFDVFDQPLRKIHGGRRASETVDRCIEWINKSRSSNMFFLWIHLFDPHAPYDPPQSFLQVFSNQSEKEKPLFAQFLLNEHHIDFDFYGNNEARMLSTIDSYDGEILYSDTELQRFYKHLEDEGLASNSLWIITSDHGEGLGNHRWLQHGKNIYNEQLHVPLIFYFSSGSFEGQRVDTVVEGVDILPTVLELVGGGLGKQPGRPQGRSLIPLFATTEVPRKEPPAVRECAFAERREYARRNGPRRIPRKGENHEDGEKYALQNEEYKYIYRTTSEDEFFDLVEDPYELKNNVGTGGEIESALREMIIQKVEQLKEDGVLQTQSVDKEAREELRALGYVE